VLAVILGCLLFVLLVLQFKVEGMPAALITIGATFLFRVLAIQFNWKTGPVWRDPGESPKT